MNPADAAVATDGVIEEVQAVAGDAINTLMPASAIMSTICSAMVLLMGG